VAAWNDCAERIIQITVRRSAATSKQPISTSGVERAEMLYESKENEEKTPTVKITA